MHTRSQSLYADREDSLAMKVCKQGADQTEAGTCESQRLADFTELVLRVVDVPSQLMARKAGEMTTTHVPLEPATTSIKNYMHEGPRKGREVRVCP